jgi:hypothetical protein
MRRTSPRPVGVAALAVGLWLAGCGAAGAQHWPTEPVAFAGGRVLVAGDASATFGTEDPGWFTYTDYETSAIRRLRSGVTVEARASEHVSFLAEIRAETGTGVTPYAWYVRVSPFGSGVMDIQAGRIPPVFGAFARRSYPQDNPLIGSPLAYQYLTSLRPDAIPATADDLLQMRGHGWQVSYPVGNPEPHNGVPVVAAERWDTGVEMRVGRPRFEAAAAYTVGSLSSPRVQDDNGGRQVAGRVSWHPVPAFAVAVSAADGRFVADGVRQARPDAPPGDDDQRAWGIDAEASWGRWLVRGEFVASRWKLPPLDAPQIRDALESRAGYVEAKIRLGPRLYAAVRGDQLRFSSIAGSSGTTTWDANVSRVEYGVGYTVRRGFVVKASGLSNWRDGGRVRASTLAAVQALFWF